MSELRTLSVRDVMVGDPVVIGHDASVATALRTMLERRINSIVISHGGQPDGEIQGIFTPRDLLDRAVEQWDDLPVSALMTPRPVAIDAGESFAEAATVMERHRIRHLPVMDQGRLVGIVSVRDLMEHRTRELEQQVQRQTSELEAKNAALTRRSRTMNYHVELAGRIQRQLLEKRLPVFEPFTLAAHYRPYDRVSGDCYDVVELAPDRLGLLIADASGHGVPAAFVSVMARSIFQAVGASADSPAAVLHTMNDQLPTLIEQDHFITMWYATLDRKTFRMTYASAGHPPPLWYRHAENAVEPLANRGHMIGVLDHPDFEDRTVQLRPNDSVLLYTDGLIESAADDGGRFGIDRAARALRERGGDAGAVEIVDGMIDALSAFAGARFGDDVTCVALSAGPEGVAVNR